jgi:hypothetical protein
MLIESDTIIQLTCYNESQHDITFSLGVDSLKQAKPLYSGDLNPLKNMYWTWQSGYIQLKAEGKIHKPNGSWEAFQLHLGGFRLHPTHRWIQRSTQGKNLELTWDENQLSQILQLNSRPNIMSECSDASLLMTQIAKCLLIQ